MAGFEVTFYGRIWVAPKVDRHSPLSEDANDDMVLEVAINGSADAILTNNAKHFREAAIRFQLQILKPAELLKEFRIRR